MFYKLFLKRVLDVLISLAALIVLAPLILVVALLVRLRLGSPVLFTQRRPGLGGKLFTMYKFRTMIDNPHPIPGEPQDTQRMTPFGTRLRALSLDELPELFNVLRGDMSMVGPRPLLEDYLARYTPEQARRHAVKPGITGWAQINGRNALSWEDHFALDVWYVDHQSLWLDFRIMFKTVWKVLRREGISEAGRSTRGYFMGEDEE